MTSWFGVGSITASFLATLITAWMWLQGARATYRSTRLTGQTITSAIRLSIQHLRRIPVHRTVFAVCATLAGFTFQAIWVGMTYVFISVVAENWRETFNDQYAANTQELLHWNGGNGYYTLACILLLVCAYALAATRRDDYVPLLGFLPAILPALAGVITALLAAAFTIFYILAWLITFGHVDSAWSDVGMFWFFTLILIVYSVLGFAALRASALIASMWKGAPVYQATTL
ncbi:hypothetical protein [Streptomyces cinnamoneus]|uniref:hypothetical protein n=1 Tax=Streptomyces cinnamoneus TaxID=53446 RepID=UPI00167D955B|nr:hypothetical protein [Streptomyces cinnamoneus]